MLLEPTRNQMPETVEEILKRALAKAGVLVLLTPGSITQRP